MRNALSLHTNPRSADDGARTMRGTGSGPTGARGVSTQGQLEVARQTRSIASQNVTAPRSRTRNRRGDGDGLIRSPPIPTAGSERTTTDDAPCAYNPSAISPDGRVSQPSWK